MEAYVIHDLNDWNYNVFCTIDNVFTQWSQTISIRSIRRAFKKYLGKFILILWSNYQHFPIEL
jgi:hypothetical protein